jgi:hypothetical protein
MNKFSKIQYTDAYYILEEPDVLQTLLPKNEAFGYVEKKENTIVVHFILRKDSNDSLNAKMVMGLVLPISSIDTQNYLKELDHIQENSLVALTWEDVVFLQNDEIRGVSTMYTEGIVIQNNSDHLVIKNPETLRIKPEPVKNHPQVKPLYYVIPKSFIIEYKNI